MAALVSSHINHIGGTGTVRDPTGGDISGVETDDDMPGLESVDSSEVGVLQQACTIAIAFVISVFR